MKQSSSPLGMVGDGIHCSTTDPCSPNPCFPGSACVPDHENETFQCDPCPEGLIGDGKDCFAPAVDQTTTDQTIPCPRNITCFPGVTACVRRENSFVVCGPCPEGFTGNGEAGCTPMCANGCQAGYECSGPNTCTGID